MFHLITILIPAINTTIIVTIFQIYIFLLYLLYLLYLLDLLTIFYLKIKLCSNFFYKHQFLILPITDNSIIFTDELSKSIFYNNYLYRIYNNNNTNL